MTIILNILWVIFKNEWRQIMIVGMLGTIIFGIYHKGYETCENQVAIANAKVISEEQVNSEKKLKALADSHQAEITKHLSLEQDLTNEINKSKYRGCSLTAGQLRVLNRLQK